MTSLDVRRPSTLALGLTLGLAAPLLTLLACGSDGATTPPAADAATSSSSSSSSSTRSAGGGVGRGRVGTGCSES